MDDTSPSSSPRPTSFRTILICIGCGMVLAYLSTWIGPVTFYYTFQKPMAEHVYTAPGGVVWSEPRRVNQPGAEGWSHWEQDGILLPLPPGELESVEKEGRLIVARFAEGQVNYQLFPPGFILGLYRKEVEVLGGTLEESISEMKLLEEIVTLTPASYRFDCSEEERQVYGARLLSKMLLWADYPVQRLEISTREDPPGTCVFVKYDDGSSKALTVTLEGTLVVMLPDLVPESWCTSPANWFPPPPGSVQPDDESPRREEAREP